MSIPHFKQKCLSFISLTALLSALVLGLARFEGSQHTGVFSHHTASHTIVDASTDAVPRHP